MIYFAESHIMIIFLVNRKEMFIVRKIEFIIRITNVKNSLNTNNFPQKQYIMFLRLQ